METLKTVFSDKWFHNLRALFDLNSYIYFSDMKYLTILDDPRLEIKDFLFYWKKNKGSNFTESEISHSLVLFFKNTKLKVF